MEQSDRSRLPFDQGSDDRGLATADDEIAFPMSGLGAVPRRERPIADGGHGVFEPRPAPLEMLVRAPVITPGTQRRPAMRRPPRRPHQRRSWLVHSLVDAFVTQPHPRIVRERRP